MNKNMMITKNMLIGDILRLDSSLAPILMEVGMHCLGCPSAQMESLADACKVYGVDAEMVVSKLNSVLEATV